MCLNEEQIRRIVREEMSNFLDSVGKKVDILQYAEPQKMEGVLVAIIETVSKREAEDLIRQHEDGFNH